MREGENTMQSFTPVLVSLLLSLGIILAVDLIITHLRRKFRQTVRTSEGEPTKGRAGESTD